MGEYHLTEEYASIQVSHATVEYISCSCPADIVEKIRHSAMSSEAVEETKVKQELVQSETKLQGISMYARAKRVIGDNNISFDPKLNVFNVEALELHA